MLEASGRTVMAVARLSALDAGFLAMETDEQPLHVGALLVLAGPAPPEEQLLGELARRLARAPACRRRVRRSTVPLLRPVWEDDPSFDVARHLHRAALDGPADQLALRVRVRELMARPLDRTRPLWEAWTIAGTGDGPWSLLIRAHHTMVDGVSGSNLLGALLGDTDQLPAEAPADRSPRVGLRRLRQGLRTVAVPDLPECPLHGPISARRSWDWTTLPLQELRSLARARESTVNDVYLALLSAGLARAMAEGLADPGVRVRCIVPASRHGELPASRGGNLDAAFFVELPVHAASPAAMLRRVTEQTKAAKAAGVPAATESLLRAADAVPAALLDRAARSYVRRGQARVNLAATNVRGPDRPLELCGRRVLEVVPCLPLALEVRVTSAIMSYAGRAVVSVTADEAALADASLLTDAIAQSWTDLVST